MTRRTLILWDIDGTLLSTGGAGRAALDDAFEALHGISAAFSSVDFGGRTDYGIVRQAYAVHGLELPADGGEALLRAYLPRLRERLALGRARIRLCPGVPEVLDAAGERAVNALLTGNWAEGARHKLDAVGLWDRFAFGAFGDDSADRNALVPVALRRAHARGLAPERVVVIGDTPHDVACARAGGAVAVAVSTGWSSKEELVAAAPDLLIDDLVSGREALLEALG